MTRTILKWALPIIALLVVGPLWALVVQGLRAPDGGHDVSFLYNASPAMGVGVGVVAFVIAGVVALITCRLFGPRVGVYVWGLGLLWPAWVTGSVGVMLRADPQASTLIMLAIEGALIGAGALVGVGLLSRVGGADHADDDHRRVVPFAKGFGGQIRRTLTTSAGLAGLGAGVAGAIGAAWLIAQTDMRGQALLAALGAGIVGAVAARLVGSALSQDAPVATPFIAVALAAVLAPLVGMGYPGAGGLTDALVTGSAPGFLFLQPADWGIGILLGVPIGLSWVGELEHIESHAKSPAVA
ncbi:MAG: hypothetical protein DHS20C14_18440 [Phycisphaeraceae bacterium]|nr:MAG: hypothetical protein DHS20C14_18440 [Phycisphaeraceae bacterium]